MVIVGQVAVVKISAEKVFILEEVKFTTKQGLVEGPEGAGPVIGNVKVPVATQTFLCRRYVPAVQNIPSRYETLNFTASELD